MTAARRKQRILEMTGQGQECSVHELADQFDVSEMTVRRDLADLADQGRIVRTHGGAAPASGVMFEFRFLNRVHENRSEKDEIARVAGEMVNDGDTVILDSGTTTLILSETLRAKKNLSIVTTSLPVASKLQYCDNIDVVLLGGRLRHDVPDLMGALTLRNLQEVRADTAFIGADAIDEDGVVYNKSIELAHLLQTMSEAAEQVYIVADSSKLHGTALAKIGTLTEWSGLITDNSASEKMLQRLRKNGVDLFLE
ncbi:MAG: DeoR/GlpR transcriptional regulator [Planctomycetes bacterium]|nr:DeoR/GlpR transcriptional regulator [Planctomycetota bacterium]